MNSRGDKNNASPGERRLEVLIVDDHPIVREGVRRRIEQSGDMGICGEAASLAEALSILARKRCDLAVVDISIEGRSGLELIKEIRGRGFAFPILVLSFHEEPTYVERALAAGAQGYLHKNQAPELLLAGIEEIRRGNIYVCPGLTKKLIARLASGGASPGKIEAISVLSDRELEVLEGIGEGYGTRKIAERLCLSLSTVETYKARIKKKLQIKSAAELAAFASRWVANR